jgi:hypothetical protein
MLATFTMYCPLPPIRGADRLRPIGVREVRWASLNMFPRDFGLAEDRRGHAHVVAPLIPPLHLNTPLKSRCRSSLRDFPPCRGPRHLEDKWEGPRQPDRKSHRFARASRRRPRTGYARMPVGIPSTSRGV